MRGAQEESSRATQALLKKASNGFRCEAWGEQRGRRIRNTLTELLRLHNEADGFI